MLAMAEKIDGKLSKDTSTPVSLSRAVKMVGSSRQLLAWKTEHFHTLAFMRDCWEIDETQYAFLMAGENAIMKQIASAQGFKPSDHKTHGRRAAGHQIDAAFEDEEKILRVATRCALCLNESNNAIIRNRFELIVALLSISGCGRLE